MRMMILLLVTGFIYAVTGELVFALIIGTLAGFSPKRNRKPYKKLLVPTNSTITLVDDPLGERRERKRQNTAIRILIASVIVITGFYILLLKTNALKEIAEWVRIFE